MLGHRGCRLGNVYPEITEMQTRAIIRAAIKVAKKKRRRQEAQARNHDSAGRLRPRTGTAARGRAPRRQGRNGQGQEEDRTTRSAPWSRCPRDRIMAGTGNHGYRPFFFALDTGLPFTGFEKCQTHSGGQPISSARKPSFRRPLRVRPGCGPVRIAHY